MICHSKTGIGRYAPITWTRVINLKMSTQLHKPKHIERIEGERLKAQVNLIDA
jgi:hypothetical protein